MNLSPYLNKKLSKKNKLISNNLMTKYSQTKLGTVIKMLENSLEIKKKKQNPMRNVIFLFLYKFEIKYVVGSSEK